MTVAKAERITQQEAALRFMASEVGDDPLYAVHWVLNDEPALKDLLPTTWAELKERGEVEPRNVFGGGPQYHLTEAGWVLGLQLNGTLREKAFRDRCVDLVKYFKSQVVGRADHHDALVSHHEVQAAGFPFGFVLNVLKAGLLQEMFPDKRMNARWDTTSKIIRVPVTFGMPV
jgi:hypothetical protein